MFGAGGGFEDIFSFFEGGGGGSGGVPPFGQAPPPPPPTTLEFPVTLEDLYCGRKAKLVLSRTILCPACEG